MRQQPPKRFGSDLTLANVLVTVHAPAERDLRIIHVKNRHALEADGAIDQLERRGQSSFALDVIARCEKVRGIEASGYADTSESIEHLADFFQARPERGAHSRGVLDQ